MTKSKDEKPNKPSSNQTTMTEREAMDRVRNLAQRLSNQGQSPEESSEPPARGSLTSGALTQQIKNLTEDYIDNSDKVSPEYKGEQADDKIPNPDVETLIQKLYQSREAMPMEAEDDDKANSNGK